MNGELHNVEFARFSRQGHPDRCKVKIAFQWRVRRPLGCRTRFRILRVAPMQVIVVGGGIGGLSLALSLHQAGIAVRVYEAVRELAPLGVGINLQPNAVRELTELGLGDELAPDRHLHQELSYFNKFGQLIHSEKRGICGRLSMAAIFDPSRPAANPAAARSARAIGQRRRPQRTAARRRSSRTEPGHRQFRDAGRDDRA